jgi:hypothetical protein
MSELGGFELSEVDQRILELNHQGYSYGKISKLLKAEGITLSKSGVKRHILELRQDPENMVQTNYKCTSRKPKEDTKEYKIASRLVTYLPEYKREWGVKPSSRTAFYDFQDLGIVTKKDENVFTRITVHARLGFVGSDGKLLYPKLDIDCFSDTEDHSKVAGSFDDFQPTDPIGPPDPETYIQYKINEVEEAEQELETAQQTAEENLEYAKKQLLSGPAKYNGLGASGRRGGRWYGQPEHVEVWEEKVDLVENFEQLLSEKGVKVRGNGGFPSLVFLNLCCVELKATMERLKLKPEHIHIKYCGDCDPSGIVSIDYYIKKRLKQLGMEGIDFKRIAVTPKQIKQYHLPLMNIKKNPKKKAPDPNLNEFERLYGDEATHLNAFMTIKHKDHFKKILYEAVDEHWSQKIYDSMVAKYEIDPPRREDVESDREMMWDMIGEAGYSEDDSDE